MLHLANTLILLTKLVSGGLNRCVPFEARGGIVHPSAIFLNPAVSLYLTNISTL